MRIACLRVPDLPWTAARRAHPELAGRPVAVAAGPGPRSPILAVSPEAARLGVRPGTSRVQARAASAVGLCIVTASPAGERAAREALRDAALSASPRAVLAPPGQGLRAAEAVVFADATGVVSLFRSEAGFASVLVERARGLGLDAVAAVAGSREVARLATRVTPRASSPLAPGEAGDADAGGGVRVLPPGAEAAFLAPLPLDLLEPSDALAQRFTRFGLYRVRDLARLPRRTLAGHLGPEALRLAARIRGEGDEPPLPAPTSRRLEEASDLEYAVDRLEALAFVLRGLLSRLAARLEVRGLACGDLELDLALEGGARDARRVGVAAPTTDVRVLVRLAGLALEAQPPAAPVTAVRVASEGRPARRDQLDLFRPAGPAPAVLGRVLAELESLCGESRVGTPVVPDTHHPDAVELRPFGSPGSGSASSTRHALALRLFRPPLPAQVRTAAGAPRWLRSAVVSGAITRVAGPWRTTGGWWSPDARFAFDHFDVQTEDGTLVRLRYDAVRRAWSVDALYD